ncbi:hypothetical protein [Pseudomarimonas salicorniae]|uniref:Uncharacterized protein n=1 Tax=Pseudomarimonas salicorniae TaxID=2933270 RepID=A0ABT0GL66_9GAMM|nr:hypothetical protein [Lysobacter sp. CAU 1642]MCK7595281.1 hypothetical protein [Lysobacter sp. CAU 1642]
MKAILRSILIASAVLAVAACGKQEEAPKKAEAPQVLTAPTDGNEQNWKLYLAGVVKQNMEGIRNSPFMYYLPPSTVEGFEDQYLRQLDNVSDTIARTVLPGNMLAFGSPESARMGDLIVEAFKNADAGSFKGVKVLYIGKAEDEARVREAVEPSGADFIFVEAK